MRRPTAPLPLLALLALPWIAGCGRFGSGAVVVEVADLVAAQSGQVATPRIAPAVPVGLERLGSGWEMVRGPEGPRLRLADAWSRLTFYAMPDVVAVEIDAVMNLPLKRKGRPRDRGRWILRLNGEDVSGPALRRGAQSYRVDFPEGWVRRGENTLTLSLRGGGARRRERLRQGLEVGEIRFVRAGAEPTPRGAADRSELIVRSSEGRLFGRRVIEMPTWSELELPLWLPRKPRFTGRLEAAGRGPEAAAVHARIGLEDEEGRWHELFERELAPGDGARFDLDLSRWQETLVRVTIRVWGAGHGLAELTGAEIRGRKGLSIEQAAPPPATLEPPPSSGIAGRPDVVFVLIDAARADAFGCYGSPRPTPALDALAAAGTRFAAARAPSAWTGQSVPAIFSGLYPDAAGIEHWASRLPARTTTLAERFAAAGYRTVLWSQHPLYKRREDVGRGFDRVILGSAEDREQLPAAGELFADAEPHFAFVHLLPPHTPYEPPAPFLGRYTAGATERMAVDGESLNDYPFRRDPAELSAAQRRYARDRYDENVAFADHLVGRLLGSLPPARLAGALVIVTSDHGEAFLEHGRFLHERHLYHEFIDVPLVVRWPGGVHGYQSVVERPVSLIDLLPTLVDAAGLGEGTGVQGRSLLPDVFGDGAPPRPIYARTRGASRGTHVGHPEMMLESDGFRVLLQHSAARSTLLFDLAEDPDETRDLAASDPERTAWLRRGALLQSLVNATILDGLGAGEIGDLDAEANEALRALGYLN